MKHLIETLIRKVKNPNFRFDHQLTNSMLLGLIWRSASMLIRGQLRFLSRPGHLAFIGRRISLINKSAIRLAPSVRIDDDCHIAAIGTGGIDIGARSTIGAKSRIVISSTYNDLGGYIKIGENVGIGEFAFIGGAGGTEIGDDCIIGQYFSVHPENHGFDNPDTPFRLQPVSRKGISIGKNVWIGAKVTLLDGACVGHSSVIAAGAVVLEGKYPPHSVLAGVPAKVVKSIRPK